MTHQDLLLLKKEVVSKTRKALLYGNTFALDNKEVLKPDTDPKLTDAAVDAAEKL